jgi:hypothetical protein
MLTRTVIMLLALAASAQAQVRPTPALNAPGPFSAPVVEQGALGNLQVVALDRDALFYDADSGTALLVVNRGIYGGQTNYAVSSRTPQLETACFVTLAPGLVLTAIQQDDDGRADVLGYQRATGLVYRYYRRGVACQ